MPVVDQEAYIAKVLVGATRTGWLMGCRIETVVLIEFEKCGFCHLDLRLGLELCDLDRRNAALVSAAKVMRCIQCSLAVIVYNS